MDVGLWRRVNHPDDADYTHYSSEKGVEYDVAFKSLVNQKTLTKFRSTNCQE
jgi:hypothetical protein